MKFSPFLHRARITLRRNILHFGVYCAAVYTNLAVILRDHKQAAAVISHIAFFIAIDITRFHNGSVSNAVKHHLIPIAMIVARNDSIGAAIFIERKLPLGASSGRGLTFAYGSGLEK